MKVGSLVECVGQKRKHPIDEITTERINKGIIKLPVVGNIYTVRSFTPSGTAIRLEEIVNPSVDTKSGNMEQGFCIENFREVQPPIDLTEILEYQHPIHLLQNI